MRSDLLVHILDRHVATPERARCDRAVVEAEAGKVEARERHHGPRERLVAADEADESVQQVASRDELDRVRDHLARDEGRSHPRRPHGDAVGDGDRVELHRRATGGADAALDVLCELTLVEIAGHRLDPLRRDAHERLGEVLVGESGGLEHRASPGALVAVCQRVAMPLRRVGRLRVRVSRHAAILSDPVCITP